jgi:hypothetical protein
MNTRNMSKVWLMIAGGALAGALAMSASPSVASADAAACGEKGQTPCPLQKWMRANLGASATNGDTAAMAIALKKSAAFSPDPSMADWAKISNEGAAAAAKGDLDGAKASCKGCHDKYKADYKAKFRAKPVSG